MSSASLTRVILCLTVMLPLASGCDRQSGTTAQPQAADSAATPTGAAAEPSVGIDRSHKGAALPDLTFQDAEGRTLHLPAQIGHPLLVNLWATWCAPCVAELPTLDALAARKGGVQVIALSQDMGAGGTVAAFLKGKGLTHLNPWLDPDATASARFAAASLPMTALYDAQGHEVWRWNGGNDWTSPAAARLLAEAR